MSFHDGNFARREGPQGIQEHQIQVFWIVLTRFRVHVPLMPPRAFAGVYRVRNGFESSRSQAVDSTLPPPPGKSIRKKTLLRSPAALRARGPPGRFAGPGSAP